jgi:hypothetical protein
MAESCEPVSHFREWETWSSEMKKIALLGAVFSAMVCSSAMADTIVTIPAGKIPVIKVKDLTEGRDETSKIFIDIRSSHASQDAEWGNLFDDLVQKRYLQDTAFTTTKWLMYCPKASACQIRIRGNAGLFGHLQPLNAGEVTDNPDGGKLVNLFRSNEITPSAWVTISFPNDPPCK